MSENIFDKIKRQSGVEREEIIQLAHSVKDANFRDEDVVRNLIRQVAAVAGSEVSQEKEEKMVQAITQNKIPKDLNKLF